MQYFFATTMKLLSKDKWPNAFIQAGVMLLSMVIISALIDNLFLHEEGFSKNCNSNSNSSNSIGGHVCSNTNNVTAQTETSPSTSEDKTNSSVKLPFPVDHYFNHKHLSCQKCSNCEPDDHFLANEEDPNSLADIFDQFYSRFPNNYFTLIPQTGQNTTSPFLNGNGTFSSPSPPMTQLTTDEIKAHLELEEAHEQAEMMSSLNYNSNWKISWKMKRNRNLKTLKFLWRCSSISSDPNDIKFFLYGDHLNPNVSEEILISDLNSVANSSFKSAEKTVLLIHGYFNNGTSAMPMTIKNSYMDAGLSRNVIVVEWGKLSTPTLKSGCYVASYATVVRRSLSVASQRVADLIQFLLDNQFTRLEDLHLVGFSLGAHIAGWAGHLVQNNEKNLKKEKGRNKVKRITGLDPAGPLFGRVIRLQRKLTFEDGEFVDVYHTAAGSFNLGNYFRNIGHADFFPNGGKSQPGCPKLNRAASAVCNHSFAFRLFAASIQHNFTVCRCDPSFFYILKFCPGRCKAQRLAGEHCSSNARGQFYFKTGEITFSAFDNHKVEVKPHQSEKDNSAAAGAATTARNFNTSIILIFSIIISLAL